MNSAAYRLTYEDDGVFLHLSPNERPGGTLRQQVMARLERKQVEKLDADAVIAAFHEPGNAVKIAPPQQEVLLDETVEILVAKDEMQACAVFSPPDGGQLLGAEDIRRALRDRGVVFGHIVPFIESLASMQAKEYGASMPVAMGTAPQPGQDGYIEYKFSLEYDRMPRIREDGSVDHKALNLFDNVQSGDVVAVLHAETEGEAGHTVLGRVLAAKRGKPARLSPGKNTALSPDGASLTASIDGRAQIERDRVMVNPVMEIGGNIDPSTGNIDFMGDVIIRGNVLSQYSVTATGSIDIGGIVEGADIRAGSSIVIRQGVKGMGNCRIEAVGDVTAKFIENAFVRAGGTVRADVMLQCQIWANETVNASGRRGLISGGQIHGGKDVVASTIGGGRGGKMTVSAGILPNMRNRLTLLEGRLRILTKETVRKRQDLSRLHLLSKRGGLSAERARLMARLEGEVERGEEEIRVRSKEAYGIQELLKQTRSGRIHARDNIQRGVLLEIGSASMLVNSVFVAATFYRKEHNIEMTSFAYAGE